MRRILVDATTLISLGLVERLDLLTCFDGGLTLYRAVTAEVTTQPAKENLRQLRVDQGPAELGSPAPDWIGRARELLGEDEDNGDVVLVAAILPADGGVALVSDDTHLRTVAEGLGARVTGTVGVVVRAVVEGEITEEEAKTLVRRLDSRGLHTTGELREGADELIEDAARASEDEN